MTDLDRLLHGSQSPRTRALLRAGQSEQAPERFAEHLLLEVSAAIATGALTSFAAASVTAGAKLGTAASGAATSGAAGPSLALVVAQWMALGVLGGGVLAAGANAALSPKSHQASTPTRAIRAAPPVVTPPAQHAALGASSPTNTAATSDAPDSSAPAAMHVTLPSAATSSPPSGQLGREVELIDQVRRALRAHNTSLALNALDRYSLAASTGVLDREARVLRIQALRDAGDIAGASKLVAQYLADFPDDAHAARLRAPAASVKP